MGMLTAVFKAFAIFSGTDWSRFVGPPMLSQFWTITNTSSTPIPLKKKENCFQIQKNIDVKFVKSQLSKNKHT